MGHMFVRNENLRLGASAGRWPSETASRTRRTSESARASECCGALPRCPADMERDLLSTNFRIEQIYNNNNNSKI